MCIKYNLLFDPHRCLLDTLSSHNQYKESRFEFGLAVAGDLAFEILSWACELNGRSSSNHRTCRSRYALTQFTSSECQNLLTRSADEIGESWIRVYFTESGLFPREEDGKRNSRLNLQISKRAENPTLKGFLGIGTIVSSRTLRER